jgi:crotonobetainyl-CoA:carnitine CoA-transferase CaiB-like acyl-CoA transferase
MQAFGGLMMMTGEEGRPPVRVGTSLVDMGTGMWCALGIVSALLRPREAADGGRAHRHLAVRDRRSPG